MIEDNLRKAMRVGSGITLQGKTGRRVGVSQRFLGWVGNMFRYVSGQAGLSPHQEAEMKQAIKEHIERWQG